MKGGIGDIMKQAQQVQENLQKTQEEIANTEVTGEAGAGMVKVVMTGRHDIRKVDIDPALLGDDLEMLQDLIAAAVNDANKKVEKVNQDKMADLTTGIGLPEGMKFPFS